ncbi:MAG: SAM-dependent methyltransferase [Myxococcota bacterium]
MAFDPLSGLDPEHLLEREVRLSRSVLWTLLRRYYLERADSFSSGQVPMYATSNPFVARGTAQLIAAFAEDCGDEPLTIVELGAGHGQLAFRLLQQLPDRLQRPFRYILTDITPGSLNANRAHPRLAPFFAQGIADTALFDAENDDTIRCARGTISAQEPCGPMVVIANYVFDSLRHDAFQVEDGQLQEGRVTVLSEIPHPSVDDDIAMLDDLIPLFTFASLDDDAVYKEAVRDGILNFYRQNLSGAFAFPIGAMRCLQVLQTLSRYPVLVLSLDKADNHLAQLQGRSAIHVAMHGSLSMTVNHDALARFVTAQGGDALLTSSRSGSLDNAAFVLGGNAQTRLRRVFADDIERFSPGDYLDLYHGAVAQPLSNSLKLLRLAGWDPRWVDEMAPDLIGKIGDATDNQREELREGLRQTDAQRFEVGSDEDSQDATVALKAALAPDP